MQLPELDKQAASRLGSMLKSTGGFLKDHLSPVKTVPNATGAGGKLAPNLSGIASIAAGGGLGANYGLGKYNESLREQIFAEQAKGIGNMRDAVDLPGTFTNPDVSPPVSREIPGYKSPVPQNWSNTAKLGLQIGVPSLAIILLAKYLENKKRNDDTEYE